MSLVRGGGLRNMGIGRRSVIKILASAIMAVSMPGLRLRGKRHLLWGPEGEATLLPYPGRIIVLRKRSIRRRAPWAG